MSLLATCGALMKWIKTDERLPDSHDEFLILEKGNFYLSIFNTDTEEWVSNCFCFACMHQTFRPSHWLEIEMPNKEKDEVD